MATASLAAACVWTLLAGGPEPAATPAGWERAAPRYRLDLHTAREGELCALPGVGPVLARRIVEERGRAPFERPGDLLRVRGVGPGILGAVLPHLRGSERDGEARRSRARGRAER